MTEPADLSLDVETLTIGELEEIEEITGTAFSNIDWEHPTTKVMRAIAFIAGRRNDPDFTVEDAGNVRVTAFTAMMRRPVGEVDADPKQSLSVNGVA